MKEEMAMTSKEVEDALVSGAHRVARGYLNGTTKSQAYGILTSMTLIGTATGVAATTYFIKKRYRLSRRFVKIPREI